MHRVLTIQLIVAQNCSTILFTPAVIYGQGFNNAYRRILDLLWRCSASAMYAIYGIYNLEAIIRKQTFGFTSKLCESCNRIVETLESAWIIRIQLWHTWFGVLYVLIDDTFDGKKHL